MNKPNNIQETKILLRAVARKQISAATAAKMLQEGSSSEFSNGSKVYISHGIGAGSQGTYEGDTNGAYAQVRTTAGLLKVPKIFLVARQNG